MKKYILVAALALFTLMGPAVRGADAQVFYRSGPTLLDRLVGNGGYGYGGYPAYGGYSMYSGYNAYGYNPYRSGGYGYGYNPYRYCGGWQHHYGWGGGWGGGYHHHHHW